MPMFVLIAGLTLGLAYTTVKELRAAPPDHRDVVHFGQACKPVADKYLGGFSNVGHAMPMPIYAKMMGELMTCQARLEAKK